MPKVKKGESKEEYLQRAIPQMIKKEGVSQHHAVGKAIGMYNSSQNKNEGRKRRK